MKHPRGQLIIADTGPLIALAISGQLQLIQAKRQKRIPLVEPILNRMQEPGYRFSTPLRNEILKRAGESCRR